MTRAEIIGGLLALLPPDAVLHRSEDLLVYDCDAFTIAKAQPAVVVLPRSTQEVAAVARFAHANGLALNPRGAGTGLSGGCLAAEGGIMVGMARMNAIHEIDLANRLAVVEVGVVNQKLTEVVWGDGYFFAPDPSSQGACTIGGNVAENAGGPHTLTHGVTVNHVIGLEVVLPDGEVVWLGGKTEDTPGFDLTGVWVGSEGTFGIVTQAIVRLTRRPQAVKTLLAVFQTVDDACRCVSGLIAAGILPTALEMMDGAILQAVEAAFHFGFPLDAGAVLIIEVDGLEAGLDSLQEQIAALCLDSGAVELRVAKDDAERSRLWMARKKAVGTIGRLAPSKITMDGVIPRTRLPEVLRRIGEIGARYGLRIANVFHAGDGNLHPILLFDERDPAQVEKVLQAGGEILSLCVEMGGSITGEHGVGVEKNAWISLMYSPDDLEWMAGLRRVFDPEQRLNSGKLLPSGKSCGEVPRLKGGLTC